MRLLLTGGSGFIGTNFIERALRDGHVVADLSHAPCLDPRNEKFRQHQDLLDARGLTEKIRAFEPDWVVHLAARAECDENTTVDAGYAANTVGTANLLAAVQATPSIKRLVITSTQYVCGPGPLPNHDEDYFPVTVYGQSKVETERLIRAATGLECVWTIVRPTNIWGPWHLRYRREFWKIVGRGLYVHPGREPIVRSYGYVGNVVDQMMSALQAPAELVDRRTFYAGDEPADIYEWVDAFNRQLRGRPARRIPGSVLRSAAKIGDAITAITGRRFYIQSERYRSMVTHYDTPMEKTFEVLGRGPFSLEEGVAETVRWLRDYGAPGRPEIAGKAA